MIDQATVKQWMRDANPIRDLDDVDPDELAYAVAAVHTRRAADMRAPTQHPTATDPVPSPPSRRRRAWAFAASFVVILLVVGVAAWLFPSDEAPVADEPATPTTVTTQETGRESDDEPEVAPPPDLEAPVVVDGWQQVAGAPENPWIDWGLDIEALPGGGFVALTSDYGGWPSVAWSPDGVDWFDGDPLQQVPLTGSSSLATVGDQVVVLHVISPDEIELLVGDPRSGTWERVPLDVTGIEGPYGGFGLVANDKEVLVATHAAPASAADRQQAPGTYVMVWTVDVARGTTMRNSFPISATLRDELSDPPLVEWVEERWIMITIEDSVGPMGDERRNTLWTSLDGQSWSQVDLPEGMIGGSLVSGPSGVVATYCAGMGNPPEDDAAWYSPDGLEWSLVPQPELVHWNPVIASWGHHGFVVMGGDDPGVNLIASDGSGVGVMPSPFGGARSAAASEDTLIVLSEHGELWLYREPANE